MRRTLEFLFRIEDNYYVYKPEDHSYQISWRNDKGEIRSLLALRISHHDIVDSTIRDIHMFEQYGEIE